MTDTIDISNLGITAEPADIQPDEYVAPSSGTSEPVPAGTYDCKFVDGKFKSRESKATSPVRTGGMLSKKNGKTYLKGEYALQILDGKFAGRFLYGNVNTMPESLIFNEVKPGREQANSFRDALAATKYAGPMKDSQDFVNGLVAIVVAETPIRARVDWSAYSNPNSTEYAGTGQTIRGMKNFPLLDGGGHNPRITVPDAFGADSILLARNDVKALYPAK